MLTRLNIINFRCYSSLQWDLPPEGALILGNNAEGKTSLLESICVLLRLQSPRTAKQTHLIRHGEQYFGLSGIYKGHRRRLVRNAKSVEYHVHNERRADQRAYLADSGLLVWMGNDDIELVHSSAEPRRRYLDFIGLQWSPEYRNALLRYRHALRSRNVLLKRPKHDLDQIRAYTQLLIEHGELIRALRLQLVEQITPHVRDAHNHLSQDRESVELVYKPTSLLPLEEAYERALPRELILGQTLIGPHRDDLVLTLNEKSGADFASEGQQRTLALALKLAQHRLLVEHLNISPLLLIDDVFGELDPHRRHALIQALPPHTQTFITTTRLDWYKPDTLPFPAYTLSRHALTEGMHTEG